MGAEVCTGWGKGTDGTDEEGWESETGWAAGTGTEGWETEGIEETKGRAGLRFTQSS